MLPAFSQISDNDSFVSTEIDSFIEDKDSTIWICTLSNGQTVYQDDERPGYHNSAWIRLKNYCSINSLSIQNMRLKFRSHVETVGDFCTSYFFCKSILAGFGMEKPNNYYITGVVKEGVLYTDKWIVPELLKISSDERNPQEYEHCIIQSQAEKNVTALNT